MLRSAWAITLAATIPAFTAIVILTNNLAVTDAVFIDGVHQTILIDNTSDTALRASLELPAAHDALIASLPQIANTTEALTRGQHTLETLGNQLSTLGTILKKADPPLTAIISSTDRTNDAAAQAAIHIDHVVTTLDRANTKVLDLGDKLQMTLDRTRAIETRLRILLLLPGR